jgi:type I restriction enzyme S subunit
MEVKPGYKRTEVGVIPEEWDVMPVTGATSAIFLGLTSKVDYVTAGGVPLIRASDITGGRLSFDAARSISQRQHRELTKYRRAKRGDVLVSKSGSLGVCAIVDVDTHFSIYESIIVLQPNHRLDSLFLLSLLRDEATQNRMIGDRVGSTVGHLNLEVFRTLMIPVPPLREQHAIAKMMSDVDDLSVALDRLIAKKRDLKQAAMQQLLTGQTRLPGFHGEWDAKPLKEFVRQFIVPMRDKPARLTGDIPWCRIEDFDGMYLEASKSGQGVDADTIRAMNLKVYPAGTLLVSCSADLGRCAVVARPLVSNQTFIGLEMNDAVASNVFFYYLMTSKAADLNNLSSGTTISYLSREQFEGFTVFVPLDRQEQTAIAEVLTDMDAELWALEQRREKTRALKQSMMQELLTGKTRLV